MDNWNGIGLMTRIMQLALTLSLMAGGVLWMQRLKKDSLSSLLGGTGLLPGAVGGSGMAPSTDAESQFFDGLKPNARKVEPWRECPLPHPGETPSLTLMHRNFSPSGAEYECQLRFGEGDDAINCWLPLDCNSPATNAFWYPSGRGHGRCIRFENIFGEYLVDLDKQKTYLLLRYAGGVFAGEISENSDGYFTSSSTSATGEPEIHVYVGRNAAANISHTAIARSPGTHFGTIDRDNSSWESQFVPTSETVKASKWK